MPEITSPKRQRKTRWDSGPGMVTLGIIVGLAGLLIAAVSFLSLTTPDIPDSQRRLVIFISLLCTGAAGIASAVLLALGILRLALIPYLEQLKQRQDKNEAALAQIYDAVRLSDAVKMIIMRDSERAALSKTVDQMIVRGDFDAALVAVDRIVSIYNDETYGEQTRRRILSARTEKSEQEIDRALSNFEDILARHDWEVAAQEGARMERRFAHSPRVIGLVEKVRQVREQYKHQLQRRFMEAVRRGDTEAAMPLLREIDRYFTATEAEPLREAAREVITKKRENLAVQFKLAVQDQDKDETIHEAIRVGKEIMVSFPNTKMAEEVRSIMPMLEKKAHERAGAA